MVYMRIMLTDYEPENWINSLHAGICFSELLFIYLFFFNVASNICKVSVFGLCFVLRLTVLSSFAIISLRIKSAMLFLAVVWLLVFYISSSWYQFLGILTFCMYFTFMRTFFSNTIRNSAYLDQARCFVGPVLSPNCLTKQLMCPQYISSPQIRGMILKFWPWRDICVTNDATCLKIVPHAKKYILCLYTALTCFM